MVHFGEKPARNRQGRGSRRQQQQAGRARLQGLIVFRPRSIKAAVRVVPSRVNCRRADCRRNTTSPANHNAKRRGRCADVPPRNASTGVQQPRGSRRPPNVRAAATCRCATPADGHGYSRTRSHTRPPTTTRRPTGPGSQSACGAWRCHPRPPASCRAATSRCEGTARQSRTCAASTPRSLQRRFQRHGPV